MIPVNNRLETLENLIRNSTLRRSAPAANVRRDKTPELTKHGIGRKRVFVGVQQFLLDPVDKPVEAFVKPALNK